MHAHASPGHTAHALALQVKVRAPAINCYIISIVVLVLPGPKSDAEAICLSAIWLSAPNTIGISERVCS